MKVTLIGTKYIPRNKTKIREDETAVYIETDDYDMIISIAKKDGDITIEERADSYFEDAK